MNRNRDPRNARMLDHTLQRSLLVALVVMEMLLVVLAMWALYRALGRIIDENMYRIHFSHNVKVLELLVEEGMPILGAMLAVNVVALLVADRIWAFYVAYILRDLRRWMEKASTLDLSPSRRALFDHDVLEQATIWREHEALNLAALRLRIGALPDQLPADPEQRALLAARLAALRAP